MKARASPRKAARVCGVGQMKSAIAKPPVLMTWSQSHPIRRACSMRSASEKPSSILIFLRTSSALKWTALSRRASAVAKVVLPAPGKPITKILRCTQLSALGPVLKGNHVVLGIADIRGQAARVSDLWNHCDVEQFLDVIVKSYPVGNVAIASVDHQQPAPGYGSPLP